MFSKFAAALFAFAYLFVVVSLAYAQADPAQPERPAPITDPTQAGPDFLLQGEYAGWVRTTRGNEWVGLQVVALGEGKFDAVGYLGGLPGNGWDRRTRKKLSGQVEDGRLVLTGPEDRLIVADNTATAVDESGRELWRLGKMTRTSSTLGLTPPSGAIVLFDGRSTDQFQRGAKIVEGNLLLSGVTTRMAVGAFRLHLEFRTPYMPASRDQKRGNSGVYIQRRYEVQILDSFGLESVFNGAGAIYRQTPPDQNMAFPPLTWQTYDIWFTPPRFYSDGKTKYANARITVLHNGVPIHWNREITAKTGRGQDEGPAVLPIQLQSHKGDPKDIEGDPVMFRNIWIVPIETEPYQQVSYTTSGCCRPRIFHRRRCG